MSVRRWLSLGLILLAPAASAAAEEAESKRVLIVHSFGSSAPPFTTHSTAFETALTREMGKRIDLDEVSLDMARYAQPDMEEPFADFLRKRLSKWRPHLVVPIGSPAGRFVAKFRDRLFPETPVIYTGMDRRTLPPDAFQKNATFVGENFDLAGLVEDILQIAPDTNHIVVILGATPLERYWTVQFGRAFERFTNRVRFTWVNDLSFDQMLELVSRLPPRSFILLGLLLRDASGVTHNEDDALQRLHAVATAPINGLWQNQLGLGIVGGRLYQGEHEGAESARIAVRILRGEAAASFPPLIIGTLGARYDWRELRRWNISEANLPPGSKVRFREPSLWKLYRWQIIAIVSLFVLQTGLIIALLAQRANRRRAEDELRGSQAELRRLTGRLLQAQEDESRRIARELHDDLGQGLALLTVELDFLRKRPPEVASHLGPKIQNLLAHVRQLSSSVHEMSHQLHPSKLEQLGLVAAVGGLCNELSHGHGLKIEFTNRQMPIAVPPDTAVCLYRIVQEALRNAIKHSGAQHATVELSGAADTISLRIVDDGAGFDPKVVQDKGGLGLISMRERVLHLGGEIAIDSHPSGGTRLHVRVPLGDIGPTPAG